MSDAANEHERWWQAPWRFAVVVAGSLWDALRPIAPQHWHAAARQLTAAPGWQPPMLLIAVLGSFFFSHGLLGRVAALHVPYLATLGVVSLVAMYFVTHRMGTVVRRYGAWGFTRPRWWFETGRFSWIVCTVSVAATFGIGLAGLGNGGPAGDAIFRFVRSVSGASFVAFAIAGTIAYLLSLFRGLPRRGRAFECVQFFYGLLLASVAAVPLVVFARADRFALVPLAVACLAAVAAGVVALVQRNGKRASEDPFTA